MLAEIADKMPAFTDTLAISTFWAVYALLLGLFRWWLVLLFVPLLILTSIAIISQLYEPGFGNCIIIELGEGYIGNQCLAWWIPFLAAFGVAILFHHVKKRILPDKDDTILPDAS